MQSTQFAAMGRFGKPLAIILGTNEIASAVALHLDRRGYGVAMCHDPAAIVLRRGMAFHDALFGDPAELDGVGAVLAETGPAVLSELARGHGIVVSPLGFTDLMTLGPVDVLVDARMHKHEVKPRLVNLARVAIGLGPGFRPGHNCDAAVETHPARAGEILRDAEAAPADGIAGRLGDRGAERFAVAPHAGRWLTRLEIGQRVFRGFIVGQIGASLLTSPLDGIVRGLARDGSELTDGARVLEVDPRGRAARWSGLDPRGDAIGRGTAALADLLRAEQQARAPMADRFGL